MPSGDNFTHTQPRLLCKDCPRSLHEDNIADVMNSAKVFEYRSKGFGDTKPPKMAFAIENAHRLYNNVSSTVLHYDNILNFQLIYYYDYNDIDDYNDYCYH